jgi:ribosomal protein L35AE/L33A
MQLPQRALCGFKKGNHKEHKEGKIISIVQCNSPSVASVVSKMVTTKKK